MRVRTFTEVTLADTPEELAGRRPDGLIVVETGRRTWSALVEAKVRRSALEADQIEAYLKLARANGIDAVVTISNAFAAVPHHHPIRVSRVPKGVGLFHWSWISILTHAKVLLAAKGVDDPEQRFLLDELVRFLSHASTGVMGFDRMDAHWKGIVASVVAGAALPNSDAVADTVANWHQECRNLALGLMERVNSNVAIRLPRAHRDDPRRRVTEEAERLRGASVLAVEFDVPDAASPIKVEADLRTRSIGVAMTLRAPEDRKSARARANWLLRQLAGRAIRKTFTSKPFTRVGGHRCRRPSRRRGRTRTCCGRAMPVPHRRHSRCVWSVMPGADSQGPRRSWTSWSPPCTASTPRRGSAFGTGSRSHRRWL